MPALTEETHAPANTPSPAPSSEPSATPAPPAAPAVEAPAEPAISSAEKAVNEMFGGLPDPDEPDAPAVKADEPAKADTPDPNAPEKPPEVKVDDDLTPPEGMKDASRERWGKLTERVKAAETQYQETAQHLQAVQDLVGKSTLSADEFTTVLELGRLTKSTNPEDRRKAVTQLRELLNDVAGSVGMAVDGFDPLEKHPDLKAALENMEISKERAQELAQLRAMKAQTQQTQQATQEQQQQVQQYAQATKQASVQAETWLNSMAGQPGHEAKAAYIANRLQDPAFQLELAQNYRPSQLPLIIKTMYSSYTPPAPAVPPPPSVQPLRSGLGGAGRSTTPPKTMGEAVENSVNAIFGAA